MHAQMMCLDLKLTPPLTRFKSFHDNVLRWSELGPWTRVGQLGLGCREDPGSPDGFGAASGSASNWSRPGAARSTTWVSVGI